MALLPSLLSVDDDDDDGDDEGPSLIVDPDDADDKRALAPKSKVTTM